MDEATVEGGGGRVQPEEDRRCPAGRTGAKHEADPEVSWNRDPASEPLDPQTLPAARGEPRPGEMQVQMKRSGLSPMMLGQYSRTFRPIRRTRSEWVYLAASASDTHG